MQAEIINHIKFGIFSPEQIKKLSVAKLTVPDTYNEDGYPIDGGLLDQRLGVIDPGLVCKTCGGRNKNCPGHFGHIELVRPVAHSEFGKIINMLLQATCQKCHRILLNNDQIVTFKDEVASRARRRVREQGGRRGDAGRGHYAQEAQERPQVPALRDDAGEAEVLHADLLLPR